MKDKNLNNRATISGIMAEKFTFNHEVFGESFYMTSVNVSRTSGTVDSVKVIFSERSIDVTEDFTGKLVQISGSYRSYNEHTEKADRLVLSLFATEFSFLDENNGDEHINNIVLDGFICKEPVLRSTSTGTSITDFIMAVNRQYKKSDYIPCIAWSRNANFVNALDVGTHIRVIGRIQSREYLKKISYYESEKRTAYEVSISGVEVVYEE